VEDHEAERRRAAWRYLWRLIVRERRGVVGAIAGGLVWRYAALWGSWDAGTQAA